MIEKEEYMFIFYLKSAYHWIKVSRKFMRCFCFVIEEMKVLTNDEVSVGKWRRDGMKYLFI